VRRPNRYAVRTVPRAPLITEAEVFARVLTAIKTIKAMPDGERRFLIAGTKSGWVQTLVEWADLVAQAEQPKDDVEPREVYRPKRAEISDAMIAGEWFALLAIIPRNVSEHERQMRRYSSGLVNSRLVVDQLILDLWASGWPVDYIASHSRVRMSEKEVLARFKIIAADLHGIANGTAELADVDARKRAERGRQARAPANGTAVKVG